MKKTNKKGFTLIELLAVIVIIAIIATIGVFAVTKIMDNARINTLKDTAYAVKKSAKLYAESNEITADNKLLNMTPGTGADQELVDLSKDPWGKNYINVLAYIKKIDDNTSTINVYLETSKGIYFLEETVNGQGQIIASSDIVLISDYPSEIKNILNEQFFVFNGESDPDFKVYDWEDPGTGTWGLAIDNTQIQIVEDPLSQKGRVMQVVFSGFNLPLPQGSDYWMPVFATSTLSNLTPGDQYHVSMDVMDTGNTGSFNMALYTNDYDNASPTAFYNLIANTWRHEEADFVVPNDGKTYLPGIGTVLSASDGGAKTLYIDKVSITKTN